MANKELERAEEEAVYGCHKLPENIRQIGEQPGEERIYIEDYVMTFLKQRFENKQEESVSILIGKRGTGEAEHVTFIYGAIAAEVDITKGIGDFGNGKWDQIHREIHQYFSGAQTVGWACAVSLLNSKIDNNLKEIQNRYFSQEGKLFFLYDSGEREEKVFWWKEGMLKQLSGYTVYFNRNPLMQEYMLSRSSGKSMEAAYEDKVTPTVRNVIQQKEEKQSFRRYALYAGAAAVLLVSLIGVGLLRQSSQKMDSLQKTIETLSDAAVTEPGEQDGASLSDESAAKENGSDAENKENAAAGRDEREKETISGEDQSTADGEKETVSGKDQSTADGEKENVSGEGQSTADGEKENVSGEGRSTADGEKEAASARDKKEADAVTSGEGQSMADGEKEAASARDKKEADAVVSGEDQSTADGEKEAASGKDKNAAGGKKSASSGKEGPGSAEEDSGQKKTAYEGPAETDIKQANAVRQVQQSYVVQAGDTLSQIVWRHYHDMSYLQYVKRKNHIKNGNKIIKGQRLILPAYKK